jgi:hypothetical protein
VWKRFEKRLDTEMRFHLDAATQAYIAEGLPPEEAQRRALADFGALELAKDEMRDLHPFRWIEELCRSLRYAGRQFRKNPALTATVLVTLALCIGANTAIFSVVDSFSAHCSLCFTLPLAIRTGLEICLKQGCSRSAARLSSGLVVRPT